MAAARLWSGSELVPLEQCYCGLERVPCGTRGVLLNLVSCNVLRQQHSITARSAGQVDVTASWVKAQLRAVLWSNGSSKQGLEFRRAALTVAAAGGRPCLVHEDVWRPATAGAASEQWQHDFTAAAAVADRI
jgi:hypothetical protein